MNLEALPIYSQCKVYRVYQNIMESLVAQEVEKQLKCLPQHLARYLDPIDIATYALNRLPPLYASSENGRHYQEKAGKTKLKPKITIAVRQALAAVQRDPIRQVTPIISKTRFEYDLAQIALSDLQDWLITHHLLELDSLNWRNLSKAIKKAFKRVVQPQIETLSKLQNLLEKHQLLKNQDLTYENLVEILEQALLQANEQQSEKFRV